MVEYIKKVESRLTQTKQGKLSEARGPAPLMNI